MCKRVILLLGAVLVGCTSTWAAPELGLWGYYPIEENDFTDHSGNGHHGTPVDGPATVFDSDRGWVAAFNDLPDNPSRVVCGTDDPSDSGALSVAVWLKWEGLNGYYQGIAGKSFRAEDRKWILQLEVDTGTILWDGSSGIASDDPLPIDEWTHLVAARDADVCQVFVNGELFAEGAGGFEAGLAEAANVTLGFGEDRNDYDESFNGLLDEIYIFSQALSQEQVLLVMAGLSVELASEPVPGEAQTDVPLDTLLGWKSGQYAAAHDVYLGTTFDDVHAASRANPLGVLVSESEPTNTYDPADLLERGRTYYWRIDEVNAAPDYAIFKGEVWSFTTEPFAYPIEGVIATSNAISEIGQSPKNTVNGSGLDESSQHSIEAPDTWLGAPDGADPIWIQYEFDRVYKLHEMVVWNYNSQFELMLGFGLKDVTVEYSENGTDWTALGDVEFAQATAKADYTANTTVDFGGMSVRFVRLTVNSGWGTLGNYGLSEIRFLSVPIHAREPQPAADATEVGIDTTLSWRAGREAVSHDVYLASDQEAVIDGTALIDTVGQSNFTPGDLEFGSVYYWKVNEINEAEAIGSWEGTLWTFTTQEYAIIDDFESYDDEDNAIFDTWIDGWVNETGSIVGYMEAPFAEKNIVYAGKQSMPLEYDNTAAPFYSEAARDLGPMDLTTGGANSLRLHFQGNADNTPETLYVAVEDSSGNAAVATQVNSDAVLLTEWQEWIISLDEFNGVDLTAIEAMYIGLGNRDNPTAGGAGLIYIDNLQFGKPMSNE